MRRFTKGLLMTFIASAVSLGSYAQQNGADDQPVIDGFYRIINVGYNQLRGTGVMNVKTETEAQPQTTPEDAITMPGTVMYIMAKPNQQVETDPEVAPYTDWTAEDLEVINLRSQAIDASAATYTPIVEKLKDGFAAALNLLGPTWGLSKAERASVLEEMFDYMKMFLQPAPAEYSGAPEFTEGPGEVPVVYQYEKSYDESLQEYYLKSTTPNTMPLANMLIEKGVFENNVNNKTALAHQLYNLMFDTAIEYYEANGWQQLVDDFTWYKDRIHMGHTYYLIGGEVKTDLATYQYYSPGPVQGEYIQFANENKIDYVGSNVLIPEIQRAKDFAKWVLEPIVARTDDTNGSTDYFAVDAYVQGRPEGNLGKSHFYTTLYTDFAMQIVQNNGAIDENGKTVRVWGIEKAPVLGTFASTIEPNTQVGYVKTKEYTDIVPARTPVVIECSKSSHLNNVLLPYGNIDDNCPVPEDDNNAIQEETDRSFLRGIFFTKRFERSGKTFDDEDEFIYHIRPLDEGTYYPRKVLRVFNRGNNADNPLGFYKYSQRDVVANKAFMLLEEQMANINIYMVDNETYADGISEVSTVKSENNAVYDIQGRIVNNPTKGLYIVNGKKMVIK